MNNVWTVFKKEMRRFFTDPRMLLALFLPGILIYVLYGAMGRLFSSSLMETKVENTTYRIAYTDNASTGTPKLIQGFQLYVESAEEEKTNKVEFHPVPVSDVEATKNLVKEGKYDVFAVFSDNFETTVIPDQSQVLTRYIYLFYNGATPAGTKAYQNMYALVDLTYRDYVVNIDTKGQAITPNLASSDYTGAKLMSVLVPLLTMSMLFSSVVSICPDAIAGEKERGTLSAMLLTPIKRGELAFGKIAALSVTAAASGLVSFLGLLGGLPAMMQGMSISFAPLTVVLLGVLIVTTLILFVSMGTIVSAFAKTAKECSSYMAPLMVVAMAAALLPLMVNPAQIGWAFVPFVNVASCMNILITTGTVSPLFLGVTIGMNLLYTGALIFATSRMFHSERIMVK
ncbi:MAG: ABC transporter permease [Bacilli bacterium]|nr:ABC transporter permease [Bacilli bacterium]